MPTRSKSSAAMAGVLLLAACTGSATPAPSSSGSASPSSAAPTGASPAPATFAPSQPAPSVPAASAVPTWSAWQRVAASDAIAGVAFRDVAWTGTAFVATASSQEGATFLDSENGIDWDFQLNGDGDWAPERIAAGPKGVVAIGTVGEQLASFTSSDGVEWVAHAGSFPLPSLGTDTVEVTDVISTGDGWMAVGRRDEECMIDCGLTSKRSYVWTSTDGIEWARVADQASLNGGGMNSITAAGGGLIAAGVANGHAAIWTSDDGRLWSRVADHPMFGPPGGATVPADPGKVEPPVEAVGVAGRQGTYVVVGNSLAQDTCDPAFQDAVCPGIRAWSSTDGGATWSRAQVESARDGQLSGVANFPDGLIAIGFAAGCPGGLLTSPDGSEWSCAAPGEDFGGFNPVAAASSATVEVLLGSVSPDDGNGVAAGSIWYRTAP